MPDKEATGRIKINKLLEAAGWRFFQDGKLPLTDIALARLGEPRRGEVVTFTSPATGIRLIKRLVATLGDVVEMRDEALFINGTRAEYANPTQVAERMENGATTTGVRTTERIAGNERTVQFLPEVAAQRSFGP